MEKNYTVEEVEMLFAEKVGPKFAATTEGQKHLNRIAKAITNESLIKRKGSQRETYAKAAFDKKVSELTKGDPAKVQELLDREDEWKASWIKRKYDVEED